MKKKVIALIMIIPLIFLITLFSVGQVASILVDIPVSGIKITTQTDDGFIYLDMAKYNSDPANYIYLEAQVEPANAKNQNYSFKVEEAEPDVAPADITIDKDSGLLSLNGTGKAKITAVSADNGYTDSVIVNVRSSKVFAVDATLERINTGSEVTLDTIGEKEYAVTLVPDDYQFKAKIYPEEVSDSSVTWSSSNSNVVSINPVTGRAVAKLSGEAIITLDCDNAVEGFEPVTIKVTVPYNGGESGMTIEGHSDTELLFNTGLNEISFLVELETPSLTLGSSTFLALSGKGNAYVINQKYECVDNEGKRFKVTLTLLNGHPENLELAFKVPGKTVGSSLSIIFTEFKFDIFNSYHLTDGVDIYQKKDANIQYISVGSPSDENIIYEWSASSDNLKITTTAESSTVNISSAYVGDYVVTVKAYEKVINGESFEKGKLLETMSKNIHIVRGVYSIEFLDNANTYGLENLLTVGDTILDGGGYKPGYHPTLNMKLVYEDGSTGGYSLDDLEFSGSNEDIIAPFVTTNAFKLTVKEDGIATITATWKNGVHFNQEVKTSIKLRGVKGAVMIGAESRNTPSSVADYRALKRASSEGRKVILMKDVMLGWQGMRTQELKEEAFTMLTDYDWTYYQNMHKEHPNTNPIERPSIYYLIEFRNDVFGNGYTINGDYMSMAKDGTGTPLLFKGPLNFVAIETASVKAQDNVVFLVREKGVDINNVNLKGCSDSSLLADDGKGGIDLTKLNYAGTTLEISGDTTLTNSRVSNGRTLVRVFGGEVIGEGTSQATTKVKKASDVNMDEHRLKLHIESCILTNAREFLLKIGSNLSIFSEDEVKDFIFYNPNPFTNASGTAYTLYNNNNAKDDYFYDNYVITDVTLKNSVLATSGLFTIGMETHFAGNMLGVISPEWYGCGGTSFASVLNMEGDVRLYDWKRLDRVDSSTLIETTNAANEYLTLRLDKMLEKVVDVRNFTNIIANEKGDPYDFVAKNGNPYVHGGIAMYGGGRNYSCIVTDKLVNESMQEYRVNIADLAKNPKPDGSDNLFVQQGLNLPAAAGSEDFNFYMYDASSNFNYQQQQTELSSGQAYIIPIAPVSGNVIGG